MSVFEHPESHLLGRWLLFTHMPGFLLRLYEDSLGNLRQLLLSSAVYTCVGGSLRLPACIVHAVLELVLYTSFAFTSG